MTKIHFNNQRNLSHESGEPATPKTLIESNLIIENEKLSNLYFPLQSTQYNRRFENIEFVPT